MGVVIVLLGEIGRQIGDPSSRDEAPQRRVARSPVDLASADEVGPLRSQIDRIEGPQHAVHEAGEEALLGGLAVIRGCILRDAKVVCHSDRRTAKPGDVPPPLGQVERTTTAKLKLEADEKTMISLKQEVDRELNPFRSKMTAPQIMMLEQQLWRRKLLEKFGAPRLSLFYLL